MNQLFVFYLMMSAIQVTPVVVIVLSIKFGTPISFFPKMPDGPSSLNRKLRRIGLARFEQLFQFFDWDIKDYMLKLSLVACVLELITIFLIMLAIIVEVPLPFIPVVDDRLTEGIMYEILMFTVTTSTIELLPMIGLVLALLFRIQLPCMPSLTKKRPPPINEIKCFEQDSESFATIRLTRFENSEKTIIYALCRNERSGKVFVLALCQGKEAGEKPQCFLYTDDGSALEQINPAPVSIEELDEIFAPGDN